MLERAKTDGGLSYSWADVVYGLDVDHKEKGVGIGCLLKQICLGKQKAGGKEEVVQGAARKKDRNFSRSCVLQKRATQHETSANPQNIPTRAKVCFEPMPGSKSAKSAPKGTNPYRNFPCLIIPLF